MPRVEQRQLWAAVRGFSFLKDFGRFLHTEKPIGILFPTGGVVTSALGVSTAGSHIKDSSHDAPCCSGDDVGLRCCDPRRSRWSCRGPRQGQEGSESLG